MFKNHKLKATVSNEWICHIIDCKGFFLTVVPGRAQSTQGYVLTRQHNLCLYPQLKQPVRRTELYNIRLVGVDEKIRSCNCQEMSIIILNEGASSF